MYPSIPAEIQFKRASSEAALFELRMRLLAGRVPATSHLSKNKGLDDVRKATLPHYQPTLTDKENRLLGNAIDLRNKLLHCEFSSVRQILNDIEPKARGGVTQINIADLDAAAMRKKIEAVISGVDVGQTLVADTKVATHKDIYGWWLDLQSGREFEETANIFSQANSILERLVLAEIPEPV